MEDVTATDLTNDGVQIVEENTLKYTCFECNYVTTSKTRIDDHVRANHVPEDNEEVKFICIACEHEFDEVEDYDSHVKTHEVSNKTDMKERTDDVTEIRELENVVYSYILEHQMPLVLESDSVITQELLCNKCEYVANDKSELKIHMQSMHQSIKIDLNAGQIKCNTCSYKCNLNIKMKKHKEKHHTQKKTPHYPCNLCEFRSDHIEHMWNHKLDKHTGEYFNVRKFSKDERQNMLFSLVAEQNVELMEEMLSLKKGVKAILEQFTYDVEDHLKELKEDFKKDNLETKNAITIVAREVMKIQKSDEPRCSLPPSSSMPSSTKPSSPLPATTSQPPSEAKQTEDSSKTKSQKQNKKFKKTTYQSKPRVLMVGDSLVQNLHFNNIEIVTNTTIKTARAYSSVYDDGARFKNMNVTDVTKKELVNGQFDHLVLGAPTVDITNLKADNISPEDNTDVFKEKVKTSCLNMMKVAENAIADDDTLKNVTIMNHAPRYDTADVDPMGLKHNLANFANNYLLELWLNSVSKDKIVIGSHTLEASAEIRNNRQTDDRTGKYDGVHYYGSEGRIAYIESVLNILLSSFDSPAPTGSNRNNDSHTRCPQTNYMNRKKVDSGKRKYSSVVAGPNPIKTKNRFSALGQVSGNW